MVIRGPQPSDLPLSEVLQGDHLLITTTFPVAEAMRIGARIALQMLISAQTKGSIFAAGLANSCEDYWTHRPGDVDRKALQPTAFCNELGNACFEVLPLRIYGQAGDVGEVWHGAHHLLHSLPILRLQVLI